MVRLDQPDKKLVVTQFQTLLEKGAIKGVKDKSSPNFFLRLFLAPKLNNKWRPVKDLSSLNNFIKIFKFKMKLPEKIRALTKKGHWVFILD